MGLPNLVPVPADGDWAAVRRAIAVLASLKLGPGATPHFAGLDVDVLAADSLTITGLSGVLKATAGLVSGSAVHSDLGGIGANDHHNQSHALDGADHTVSGLTPGHILTALTATTFGFAAPADSGLSALTDPGADRIVFWDESDNALKWLTVSTGLDITATTLTCTITQYTDALARAALSSTATGLTYTEATGVFSLTTGYEIPTTAALAALMANPMTTAGDLVYGGVSGAPSRLGIGTEAQVLTVSAGGAPVWAAGGLTNPMTAAGDMIYGGVAGTPTALTAGLNSKVLTLVGGVPIWKYGGLENDSFGVFQTLLETYRIAGKGITALVDGIVINGLSSGWASTALSSNSAQDNTYGYRYPTGGGVIFAYNEWGDYTATAVGDVADSELRNAQSFTLAGDSAIAGVSVGIYAAEGGISDDLTVRIETDSAGSPSGTLAHASFTKGQVPTPLTWCNYTFTPGGTAIDQSQETSTVDASLGDSGGNEYRHAQSFSLSAAISCDQISLYFAAKTGSPSGNVTVRIETDNAGVPSGTLVHADATNAIASPTDSAWAMFTFPNPVALSASTTYWIVAGCDNQSTNVRWNLRNGSGYSSGVEVFNTNGGAWTARSPANLYDLMFRVYKVAPHTLAAGTYWLVVSVPAQATGKAYRWCVSRGNPYSGGALKRSTNGGAWTVINANDDGMFKVWAEDTVAVNATIASNPVPLAVVPTHCKFLVLYSETNDALTLNTDVLLYASRDGGTTFSQLTATCAVIDPRWKVAYGIVDISGQPSGQSGAFKVATANNKNVFFHGYAAQWY